MFDNNSLKKESRRLFLKKSAVAGASALGVLGTAGMISRFTGTETGSARADNETEKYPLKRSPGFAGKQPNIIFILCDDLGYGDLGCYGGKAIKTPNIDRLAKEGVRFIDYYASNAICAPSRSGLLTGRYAIRTGITGNVYAEDEPFKRWFPRKLGNTIFKPFGILDIEEMDVAPGMPKKEITLAEALKYAGYKNCMVGKWHLGDYSSNPEHNPLRHGFDRYFGVPHSNDMLPCPLYDDYKEVQENIGTDQAKLTGLYTKEALKFLEGAKDGPFFLYFAHTFPHQPLYASDKFKDKSLGGKFGDTVEEIDWSVGKIMDFLKKNNLDRNTLVFFSSDNGPWYEGSAGEFRGRKGQSYEGGYKVPLIARWPEKVPAGTVCEEPAMNIDIYPTLLSLAGMELPKDRIIDGKNIFGLITGRERKSPHDMFYFYHYDKVEGVRAGRWKYFRKMNRYTWPVPLDTASVPNTLAKKQMGNRWPLLYDLKFDKGESYNVINRYPDTAQKLDKAMRKWSKATEKNPRGWL